MATTTPTGVWILFSLMYLLNVGVGNSRFIVDHDVCSPTLRSCNFDRIYQLGDSISDTGNLIRETPIGASPSSRPPYGQTFFKHPTGRFSDGLLMIDFIAFAAGLPFLNPYENIEADFRHGANFAVAGSTALPVDILAAKNIYPFVNSSLSVQLDWMFSHFNSICYTDRDCSKKLKNSLFMVGEMGVNDYSYALLQGKTIEEVKNMVPEVIAAITDAVRRVIKYGAIRVVVPGHFPIGCFPGYLTEFQTNNSAAYDENHCLKELNNFSMYHNDRLQQAIQELNQEHPNATVVYGDYYHAFEWILGEFRSFLGVDAASLLKSCCGIGGSYDFDLTRQCGAPGVPVCPDPQQRISWDGAHLTQSAYGMMVGWLITHNILPKIKCSTS